MWIRPRRNLVITFDSFRLVAVKNVIRFGSYKLQYIVLDALRVSYIWIHFALFIYGRRKERFFEKHVFYRKFRNSFWVSRHISSIVWWGSCARKIGWSLIFDEFENLDLSLYS